jgi:hypothetical protein
MYGMNNIKFHELLHLPSRRQRRRRRREGNRGRGGEREVAV